jgi:GT2 family glycosyltransferase
MKIKDVSVIIVCRNGKNVTKKCLDGILKLAIKEVIVVDNDSTDGTDLLLEKLQKKDKRVKIISNKTNNGFAEANNQGFELSKGKLVLFLNNDTVIPSDFFPPLLSTLSHKKVAAVQPMILFPDKTIDSIGSYLTPTGFLYHRAHRMKPNKLFLKEEPVYSMKGACMLWKRSVLEELGCFTEDYFAYFEETELCHRAINAGYEVMINPTSSIIHLGGFTSNNMNQGFIQYHNAKNRIQTYLLHFPLKNVFSILFVNTLFTEALVLKTLLSGNFSTAFAIQRGIIQGFIVGISKRIKSDMKKRRDLVAYMKHPDLSYYQALFSSLQNFSKIW